MMRSKIIDQLFNQIVYLSSANSSLMEKTKVKNLAYRMSKIQNQVKRISKQRKKEVTPKISNLSFNKTNYNVFIELRLKKKVNKCKQTTL